MTARIDRKALLLVAAALVPLLLLPFLVRPVYGIGLVVAAIAVHLAWRSPAFPIALAGLPSIVFGVIGHNPLPKGAVTAIVAAWIVLALFLAVIADADNPPIRAFFVVPVIASLALFGTMLMRLGASASPAYGAQKVQLFLAGNLVLLIGGMLVGWRPQYLRIFLRLTLAVAVASALVLTVKLLQGNAPQIYPGRYATTPEESPIGLGRASADGVLIAVYLVLAGGGASRLWAIVGLPLLATALIGAGSRGPITGLVCALLVLFALAAQSRRTRHRLTLVVIAIIIAAVLVPELVPNSSITRSLSVLTGENNGFSSNGRSALWSLAFNAFGAHPLIGIGTGGFAALTLQGELYPHNIFLEAAAELGFVGLVIVALFLADVAARLTRTWRVVGERDRPELSIIIALFTADVVNALFSGGFSDNQAVWLWAGVATGMAARAFGVRSAAVGRDGVEPAQPVAGQLRALP